MKGLSDVDTSDLNLNNEYRMRGCGFKQGNIFDIHKSVFFSTGSSENADYSQTLLGLHLKDPTTVPVSTLLHAPFPSLLISPTLTWQLVS